MSTDKMSLGDRMKGFYEDAYRFHLTRRTPICLRLDGVAHHTFTRGLNKPFDENYNICMVNTALALCERIQGTKFCYTQSDEISLIITDYDTLETSAWFDYNIQKMVSVSASMAGVYFNKYAMKYLPNKVNSDTENLPTFDCRAFNIPKEEVCNLLYWRQLDCTRNSIQGLGQAHFSHKELHGKNCNEIQDMLMLQKNVNWNEIPTKFKRGVSIYKTPVKDSHNEWFTDYEMPILSQDRNYIERFI